MLAFVACVIATGGLAGITAYYAVERQPAFTGICAASTLVCFCATLYWLLGLVMC